MAFSNIDRSHKYLSWVRIQRLSEYVHYENSHDFKSVLTLRALQGFEFSYIPGFPVALGNPSTCCFGKCFEKGTIPFLDKKTEM